MIDQLSPAVTVDAETTLPQLAVEVDYDATSGTVTYKSGDRSGNPLTLPLLTEPTVVVVTLTGDPTAFSSFNFDSDAWSDQLVTSFTSAALQITVPPALGGNFKFTPQITGENDGPGSLTLQVATTGEPSENEPPNPQIILVTYDPTPPKPRIRFDPDSLTVAKDQDGTIILKSATQGLIFKGFLPVLTAKSGLSAWAVTMTVTMAGDTITINDPNATQAGKGQPINGIYGFSLAWDFQSGPLATRNPDPTIFNEPIIG